MLSLILVSEDIEASEKIAETALGLGYRVRNLSSPQTAKQWLSMQSFDVFLVDGKIDPGTGAELIKLAWKYDQQMLCGVFTTEEHIESLLDYKLLGAYILSGASVISQIETLLRAQPVRSPLGTHQASGVLFVEDLDSPRDIICAYIEAVGYPEVRGVASAEAALKVLDEEVEEYFCVITDILMPNVSGIELTRRIRADRRFRHLPVLVLTAVSTAENLVQCVQAGVTGFMAKPPKKNQLRHELEKARRIFLNKQSPRLCEPHEAYLLEALLKKTGLY